MDSRPGDEALLLAVAERDLGAFRTLYERHAGWLAIRLARRCNDRDLVADAIRTRSSPSGRNRGVVRTRTGEPGATAGAAVVLVLMAPSLVPQVARWVRTFPAPGASGPSSDHVWWIVLAVCVVAVATTVNGRAGPGACHRDAR